jgi:hypothetical protein
MEILIVLLLVGAVFLFVKSRTSSRERQAEAESLAAVRSVAEEDVTRLGEDVALLDAKTAGRELDEATRQDYRRALDSYDAAKAALDRMRRPEDVKAITGILEDGRYAMACVEARLEGRALPTRRPPCFFNPQHGPSDHKVMWTSSRSGTRRVPACSRCAAQVAAREKPEVFMIGVGGRKVPYWEAGTTYHPYSRGYFPEGQASTSAMMWMYASPDAALLGLTGYDGPSFGAHGSMDAGGFDPGGGDGGGSN